MKLKNQVCSLELSKKLKVLGVEQESLFYWLYSFGNNNYTLLEKTATNKLHDEDISAFTVAELGDILPSASVVLSLSFEKLDEYHWVTYSKRDRHIFMVGGIKSEANTRAKMLIYLIENELTVKPK